MQIDNIEDKEMLIKDLIIKNNLTEFQNIIMNNYNIISQINNSEFDVLIFAIKNDASVEFINYIIKNYKSLNYFIGKHKTPLYSALRKNNFAITQLLLNKGADVNYRPNNCDIISKYYRYYIDNDLKFDIKIFKLILKHSLTISDDSKLMKELTSNSKYTPLIEVFLHHDFYSVFNVDSIISFTLLYKRQAPLSNKEINAFVIRESSKSQINKHWFLETENTQSSYYWYYEKNTKKFNQNKLLYRHIHDISFNAIKI